MFDCFTSPARALAATTSPIAVLNIIGCIAGRISMRGSDRAVQPTITINPSSPTGTAQNSVMRSVAARNGRMVLRLIMGTRLRDRLRNSKGRLGRHAAP